MPARRCLLIWCQTQSAKTVRDVLATDGNGVPEAVICSRDFSRQEPETMPSNFAAYSKWRVAYETDCSLCPDADVAHRLGWV